MTKPRLGRFTPPANIGGALTDDEWQQIEEIYSVSINAEARSELEAIRSYYPVWLHAESAEFGTSPVEAQVLIKQIEKAAEGLRYLARFDGADCDASASIAHPLKQEFRSLPVHINPRHLLAISEDNAYMRALADEYVEPLAVLLDRDLLKAVSQSVDIAISRLSSRLNEAGGFLAGDALMALDKGLWLGQSSISCLMVSAKTRTRPTGRPTGATLDWCCLSTSFHRLGSGPLDPSK